MLTSDRARVACDSGLHVTCVGAMFFPISDWFWAFAITVTIELPIVAIMLRRIESDLVRLSILIVFANLATHLAVWYVITQLFLVGTTSYTVVAESWAVSAEAIFYWAAIRGLSARRAFAIAIAANLSSFIGGRLVAGLWPELFG
jgi:hypothetical protein